MEDPGARETSNGDQRQTGEQKTARNPVKIIPITPLKKPDRIRARAAGSAQFQEDKQALRGHKLHTVLEEAPTFKLKRIEVRPGARLSLQMHRRRSEHWVVVSGTADVVNGDAEITLAVNESTYIPAGHKHRLGNPGDVPLVIIEVQGGDYLGEDDIVRFDDQYGRAKPAA
jgi:mannose-1-phosphate guanylyltransferase